MHFSKKYLTNNSRHINVNQSSFILLFYKPLKSLHNVFFFFYSFVIFLKFHEKDIYTNQWSFILLFYKPWNHSAMFCFVQFVVFKCECICPVYVAYMFVDGEGNCYQQTHTCCNLSKFKLTILFSSYSFTCVEFGNIQFV